MLKNDVVILENDIDDDALVTGVGMSGDGGSGNVVGVATAADTSAARKVFGTGMLCYCLLLILVGFGRKTGVAGLELGKLLVFSNECS